MKKLVMFFVLMVVVVFSVITGCSKTPTSGTSGEPTAEAQQTVVVGLSYNSLVSVPGGTFTQTDGKDSFSHTIAAFKMGKYEVTYELWYTVKTWAGTNGYVFANAGMEGYDGIRVSGTAPTAAKYEPVTTISWRDIIVWCNAYSQMTGLAPVYCSDADYITPIKISTNNTVIETVSGTVDNPYVNWSASGYRLPTEGEWQYAASYINDSTWTPYNYASGAGAVYTNAAACMTVAWYGANAGSVTHNVGGKTANALDIYDMSGNVFEWCWDWYDVYPGTSTNYRGPTSGSSRVFRGGIFYYYADNLQVGYRNGNYPYNAFYDYGFRFARTN